jgi:hypothetical protein
VKRLGLGALILVASLPSAATGTTVADADGACSVARTTALVRGFVRDLNQGNADGMDRRWAYEPEFEWYFVDDERDGDEHDRPSLRLYFEERVSLNDHIRRLRLRVAPDGQNFTFKFLRSTDDPRRAATGWFHGKGAAREATPLPSVAQPLPTSTCLLTVWAMDNRTL